MPDQTMKESSPKYLPLYNELAESLVGAVGLG